MKISYKEQVFLVFLAIIVFLSYFLFNVLLYKKAGYVEISVDGNYYGAYSLDKNDMILINSQRGDNTIVIENGSCYMKEASCPDKICQKQGIISKANETITCLPNRVVIRAFYSQEEIDTIAK